MVLMCRRHFLVGKMQIIFDDVEFAETFKPQKKSLDFVRLRIICAYTRHFWVKSFDCAWVNGICITIDLQSNIIRLPLTLFEWLKWILMVDDRFLWSQSTWWKCHQFQNQDAMPNYTFRFGQIPSEICKIN